MRCLYIYELRYVCVLLHLLLLTWLFLKMMLHPTDLLLPLYGRKIAHLSNSARGSRIR